jgi:NAD(P)H-nitrite reductase large subunit
MSAVLPAAASCAEEVLCYCLNVTEAEVVAAIRTKNVRTIADVRRQTGAGDGCTACHRRLRQCLERVCPGATTCAR